MSIVLCGVDDTEAGTTVMAAAKAAAERAGAPLLLTHVSTSHWGANVPAFHADADATARVVEHGPPAQRILAVADGHGADADRPRHARAALARERRPPRRAARELPGDDRRPAAPTRQAEPVTGPAFDRAFLRTRRRPRWWSSPPRNWGAARIESRGARRPH